MPLIPGVSPTDLALIAGLAAVSAIAGGVAGYGTGALMPLVLVPILGAAPVVPIIAISAMFTNSARVLAFRRSLNRRRALIALVAALPTCVLGAWVYTLLTGRGAAMVIGTSLIATVPLRRILKRRATVSAKDVLPRPRPAGASWSAAPPAPASSCYRY